MKYYIIAGEASGDLHGANLIRELKKIDEEAAFRVWGGDRMQSEGAYVVKHYRDHAIMGFWPVIRNIRTIKSHFKICEKDITEYHPDVLILIDYSGFNLRIAEKIKKRGINIPVYYYISPQVWAWRQWRVKKIKRLIDKMYVELPFVKDFYRKHNYEVDYVGHPLLDVIDSASSKLPGFKQFIADHQLPDKPIVALFPGSRKTEIKWMLPLMLYAIKHFYDYQFVIAGAPSIPPEFYERYTRGFDIIILFNQSYQILKNSLAAIVTSGTASLETALFNVPQVVCYRGDKISAEIVRRLIKIKFVSIANLIMDSLIFKELLQENFTEENLIKELDRLLHDEDYRTRMKSNYAVMREKLGGPGASKRVAESIYKALQGLRA